jgi:chromosome segregation ATPase
VKSIKSTLKKFNWYVLELPETQAKLTVLPADCELGDITERVKDISEYIRALQQRRECCERELSNVELELTDIEHAAEFYALNAVQGYKLYKLLHDTRIKRRSLKDERIKISAVLDSTFDEFVSGHVLNRIEGLEHRIYRPRVLQELFN